ncbi:MAG: hypothetical protein GWO39_02515, partial [Gammaproteobacteria bacterium]|nr:hypothetical protein [Gammaproteobacteria bacterium]NIT62698.1 hypothetical protein [Gammaproteobacteria bacterium]NIY31278.1 hypothetical protein [Gammaproteobacteria bacterium]
HFLPGALVGRLSLALACLFGVAWLAVPAAPAADFGDPGSRMRVYWLNSRLMVGVQPQPNEGYIQLARRVMA